MSDVPTGRSYRKALTFSAIILIVTVVGIGIQPGLIQNLFSPGPYMPHSHCYLMEPGLIWLHFSADLIIGLSYVAISIMLCYLVWRASKDLPFHWVLLAFGLFIISCGFTHFMEVWTLFSPRYWLSGSVKAVTALSSIATAIVLPFVIPSILSTVREARLSKERKEELEKANHQLEKVFAQLKELDEIKSQFFANISHELRTPIALILGPVEKLATNPRLETHEQQDLKIIRNNAQLLLRHVNDLLDASKLESGKVTLDYSRTDLSQLVKLSAANFDGLARDQNITYEVKVPETLVAEVDAPRVQRILLNLLSNAFKATPKGGSICCRLIVEGSRGVLEVADSGKGIPLDMREAIFERFRQLEKNQTRQFGGTGLGLAIAKDFVSLHGGEIGVDQSSLGGALFRVTIPLNAPSGVKVREPVSESVLRSEADQTVRDFRYAHSTGEMKVPAAPVLSDRGVVLVVEDNPDMRGFIQRELGEEFHVVTAANGREGLDKLRELTPDLILTDIMMPGMSGEEMIGTLNEMKLNLPVIVLSARADDEMRIRLLRSGVHDYLVKPFSSEELKLRVSNVYRETRARSLLEKEVKSKGGDLIELARQITEINHDLELRVQQRTEEIESFAYSVSHDLRAPLRAIVRFADVLIEDHANSLNEEGRQHLLRIIENGKNMTQLIDDLLVLSMVTRSSLKQEEVDLDEVIRSVAKELAEANPEYHVDFKHHPVGRVIGDAHLLKQVYANLLSNAFKFSRTQETPVVEVGVLEENGEKTWFVRDNGIGFDMKYADKLFKLFARLHSDQEYEGTGIGLTIVDRIVRRHGGRVWVESCPGRETTFYFTLEK